MAAPAVKISAEYTFSPPQLRCRKNVVRFARSEDAPDR
jgi:hypothetical protein